jgi:hypothetical protein
MENTVILIKTEEVKYSDLTDRERQIFQKGCEAGAVDAPKVAKAISFSTGFMVGACVGSLLLILMSC